jgi:uncharacterized protein YukJ
MYNKFLKHWQGASLTLPKYMLWLPVRDEDGRENPGNDTISKLGQKEI